MTFYSKFTRTLTFENISQAQMVAARTPMAWENNGQDTRVELLLADPCRFDEKKNSLMSTSQLRKRGADGEACLARLEPSETQAAAVLQGTFLKSSITYETHDAASGHGETKTEGADMCRKCICWTLMTTNASFWSQGVSWPTAIASGKTDGKHKRKIQLADGSGVCDSQFRELTIRTWVVTAAGVVIVVALNAMLRIVVSWLGTFKRHTFSKVLHIVAFTK